MSMPFDRSAAVVLITGAAGTALAQDATHGGIKVETAASQPCWTMDNGAVRLAVTQKGAHMAPVTFQVGGRAVQPYYVSPWQDEKLTLDPPVLVPLRGDFFCLPFGGNGAPYQGTKFLPHGEPAGAAWTLAGSSKEGVVTGMTLSLATAAPAGTITKSIRLVDGQSVVYSQEKLEGYGLRTSIGHHAILAVPEKEGSLRIATSKFRFGMTSPVPFSNPANREYQSFAVGERFDDLRKVPLAFKGSEPADCTSFPARTGYADLLAVFSEPADRLPGQVAWTTATNQEGGYVWFSLRDPTILPTTVFWIENHGRHGSPWNGRNRCLGLEDVCSYLNEGMPISAEPNAIEKAGIPTCIELRPDRPTLVNYIQGVAAIPEGFEMVKDIEFGTAGITLVSTTGKRVAVAVHHGFIRTGTLPAAK